MVSAEKEKESPPMEILFVDDEKNVLQSLRRLFMDEDFDIVLANSGEEALDILIDRPGIGLIVSDQKMPGLTGSEFLARARSIAPDAVRILLTGYADINAVSDAVNKGGIHRYITKPWKDEEIIQVIKEAAEKYRIVQENKRLHSIIERQNDELKKWNAELEYYVQQQTLEIQKKNDELNLINQRLQYNFKNSIRAFSALIGLRDRRTANHSKQVAELSTKIAGGLGLEQKEIENIGIAALLHDIGKIGMTDMLLLKGPEDMDDSERKIYEQHSIRGQAAIDAVESLRDAGVLIRHHHEWFNGEGFPDGLAGDDIPVGARIISLADYIDRSFAEFSGDSPYAHALQSISKLAGRQFDAELIKYLKHSVDEVYAGYIQDGKRRVEVELPPDKLKVGMVLARDVKSGTGLTLLTRGFRLTAKSISSIQRYYRLDPSRSGVYVWVERN
jgi:response regulator RpfG family c-di-GMP phosphodiesterase